MYLTLHTSPQQTLYVLDKQTIRTYDAETGEFLEVGRDRIRTAKIYGPLMKAIASSGKTVSF